MQADKVLCFYAVVYVLCFVVYMAIKHGGGGR